MTNNLRQAVLDKKFLLTAEVAPPKGGNPEADAGGCSKTKGQSTCCKRYRW